MHVHSWSPFRPEPYAPSRGRTIVILRPLRPSRVVAIAIIAAAIVSLANCERLVYGVVNAPSYVGLYGRQAGIAYGTDPRQSLDVYVPRRAVNRPVVVFWYGGVWTRGTKERYRFVGAALANSGYVAILPDYRLYPQAHFPAFVEDGARAVQWVRAHAANWQPVALVNGPSPTALLLHGADDYVVPPMEAMELEQKLRAAGVRVECHIYNGTAHGDIVTAFSPLFRAEAPSLIDVRQFIDGTMAAPRLARTDPGTPCPAVRVRR